MKAEYINPLIAANTKIMDQVTGLKISTGKMYIKDRPYKSENIIVLMGITGAFHASVVLSFSKAMCCKIASAMMECSLISEIDEIAESAVGELCNMILGYTSTLFYKENINVDITPPTILTGDNIQLSVPKTNVVCLPFIFEDELHMEINLSFAEDIA